MSVTLVCGARNAGKSVYCRALLNSILNHHEKVAFLDIDVGQGDGTPEGYLSLSLLSTPQFRGSTVCHINRHLFSAVYFGEKSPENQPAVYVECMKFLVERYTTSLSKYPLVINTCGWIKGVGAEILNATKQAITCSHVVFIQLPSEPEKCPIESLETSRLVTLYAQSEGKKKQNTKSLRTQRLVQYFVENRRGRPGRLGDSLLALPRFFFALDRVQCYLRDSSPVYYYLTLSGSVVGLAVDPAFVPDAEAARDGSEAARNGSEATGEGSEAATQWTANVPIPRAKKTPKLLRRLPVCAALGLGIVHSVDLRRNRIVVLSPLPRSDMERVNTLVISASPIPAELLSSSLPYSTPFQASNLVGAGCLPISSRTNLKRDIPQCRVC